MRVRPGVLLSLGAVVLAAQAGIESAGPQAATQAARPASRQAPNPVTPAASHDVSATQRALVERYCIGCHSAQQKARGVVPTAIDPSQLSDIAGHAREWEGVVRRMRAGLMPPAGMPRPDAAQHEAFLTWLEGQLDRAAQANPNPGRKAPFHRLNRTEYRNAVRDLLGLDLDVTGLLPADDSSYGFDNIAGVLKLSPTLMERYLGAARKISRMAVGTPAPFPTVDYFRVADDLSQEGRLPTQAPGTRGGTSIRYTFPMDARYTFKVQLSRDLNEQVPLYQDAQNLEVSIDGERVHVFTLPGVGGAARAAAPAQEPGQDPPADADAPAAPAAPARRAPAAAAPAAAAPAGAQAQAPRPRARTALPDAAPRVSKQGQEQRNRIDRDWEITVPVKAGTRDVQVAFLKESSALAETARLPFARPYPAAVNVAEQRGGAYLRSVEISGPLEATGSGNAPSRQRIFTCYPTRASQERACATTILRTLTRRAFRRAVTASDIAPMLAAYDAGRAEGTFDQGVEQGVLRLLVSPEFLMRIEIEPAPAAPRAATRNTVQRLSDYELASRLSFFLWSSIPDDELLGLAERGQLHTPAVLDAQVTRMMADARFSAFVEGFAGQWLFLRNLSASIPVQQNFPDFDDALRQAFRRETELFFESIIRENRSAFDLLRANYTFVNERLALHYGIPNVKGTRFRRVTFSDDSTRAGLLGQGSILTVTSYPDRTSPVVRGKWVLENLLGSPPPAPPPNVPPLQPSSFSDAPKSVRERMTQHRANPVCASCHRMMDPIGLSLENFDGVGRWRTREESGASIDASGSLPDGTAFVGAKGLTQALLRNDVLVRTMTEKMMTYALGRGVEYYDAPAVRAVVRASAAQDYRVSTVIREIVRSAPFQFRRLDS